MQGTTDHRSGSETFEWACETLGAREDIESSKDDDAGKQDGGGREQVCERSQLGLSERNREEGMDFAETRVTKGQADAAAAAAVRRFHSITRSLTKLQSEDILR